MDTFKGIFAALLTPFNEDESVNYEALEQLVGFVRKQGLQGIYVGGSSGEAMLQPHDERVACLEKAAEASEGKLTLIAHVGTIATKDAIALADAAAKAGYQAISAITPYYYGFSRDEVLAHYLGLADASSLPLIIYNFPARTASFSTKELTELLAHPNIIGIKHTSSDMYQLERLKTFCPDALLFNGYDEMCLAGLASGADGAIGTTYNFMGDLFVALREFTLRGNIAEARKLQAIANRAIDALIEVGVMPGSKEALEIMGIPAGVSRRPFRPLTKDDRALMKEAILPIIEWREAQKNA
nr:N-acetylneuraminate lyase [uncultured Cohaesibacter sp.]